MTVTVKLQELVLPHASVAVQVTLVLPTGNGPGGVLHTTVGAVSVQLSPNSTLNGGGLSHCPTVMLPGQLMTVGGELSSTVIVWLFVELLPQASVAVQVRVTLNSPAHDPGVLTSFGVSV